MLEVVAIGTGTVDEIKAYIYSDSSGGPGSVLHTFGGVSNPAANTTVEFTAPGGVVLDPSTTYWVMFGITQGQGRLRPLGTRETLEDPCAEYGWFIGGVSQLINHADIVTVPNFDRVAKFAVIGAPVGPGVPENRCQDLPAATSTAGKLSVGGAVTTAGHPRRDRFGIDLKANVLYQFDVRHTDRRDTPNVRAGVVGNNGTTLAKARIHRVLDSTGAAVTSGVEYLEASDYGTNGEQVFFTPSADGTYYLETGGTVAVKINNIDVRVAWGSCSGYLPPDTARLTTWHDKWSILEREDDPTVRYDYWRHPDYEGRWVQYTYDGTVVSCTRKFDFSDIRNASIYHLEAGVADEYSADTSTTGVIAAGQTLGGHLYRTHGSNDDEDWVKIAMTQGTTYRFTYGTLHGGHLLARITGIYDSGGTMVQGPVTGVFRYPNAYTVTLEYTAPSAGNYYIGLDSANVSYATDWRLSLSK